MDRAGVLLEQVRRMEWDAPGLTAEERETQEDSPLGIEVRNGTEEDDRVYNLKKRVNQEGVKVNKADFDPKMAAKTEKMIVNQLKYSEYKPLFTGQESGSPGEEPALAEGSALSVQLARMDRAAPVPAGPEPVRQEGRGGEYPRSLPGSYAGVSRPLGAWEENWTGGEAGPERRSDPGGELLWAERADRAFRRDSRRYDGGFYLY